MRIALVGMLLALWGANAQAAELKDLRIWAGPESTRVVFDLSASAEHKLFTLENPRRIVIDLDRTALGSRLDNALEGKGLVQRIRTGKRKAGDLRVVLDVDDQTTPKSFSLPPSGGYGHRVVIDLHGVVTAPVAEPASIESRATGDLLSVSAHPANEPGSFSELRTRPIVIAVDAGHGGEDPGAKGPSGALEKDVALGVARRLKRLIDAEPGFSAVMIRDGDYYVGLRERMTKAREAQADLFVSVHANAFHDHRVRGSAVYALSTRGASSEHARLLADRENASDLIGGVHLNDKDDTLAAVLIDISQTSAIEASLDLGGRILGGLGGVNKLHKRDVQQAGFAVLKAPDIPSVLVETAFITNPQEERLLTQAGGQQKIAESIMDGVRGYFAKYRPLQYVATGGPDHNYVVRSGDTLSHVASRYKVSLNALRRANALRGDLLRVGDVLTIPIAN